MPKIIKKKKCENSLSKRLIKHSLPINGRRKNLKNITIGNDVFERYECAKRTLCYKNDDDFLNYMLNVIENQTRSIKDGSTNFSPDSGTAVLSKKIFKPVKRFLVEHKMIDKSDNDSPDCGKTDCFVKKNSDIVEAPIFSSDSFFMNRDKDAVPAICNENTETVENTVIQPDKSIINNDHTPDLPKCTTIDLHEPLKIDIVNDSCKKTKNDDKKDSKSPSKNFFNKSKMCHSCEAKHSPKTCPMLNSEITIEDSVSYQDWLTKKLERSEPSKLSSLYSQSNNSKENLDANVDEDVKSKCAMTYSEASLPEVLEFSENDKGLSVLTKSIIKRYTRLGPLVASSIKETDIADDCSMDKIWEIYILGDDDKSSCKKIYFNLDSLEDTNWMRHVKPAALRSERNTNVLMINDQIYLVTCKELQSGEELLYWIDDVPGCWSKKKLEKINCGGCNLKFSHVLHYRTHCSVFHDPAFSLTIRKYHCKVCGEAVLGKENIMKHAAEKHDGKGAYQCQYCKKFFLRLNYLEMHRTYGCAMNPQRARPLCDHCGREFCQPQKLKVHIQRMHSDMADVLRDFQCKLCSKILGSRAALQRHNKEVHHHHKTSNNNNSNQEGNNQQQTTSINSSDISCSRCGKTFQNKSNLKIHMLTHSGVKPFKCLEGECKSAFTTKQCLQFHYKKVHGYTSQNEMPKIERSVAYTFDAYAGEADAVKENKKEAIHGENIVKEPGKSENMPHNIENLVDIKNSSSSSSSSYNESEIIMNTNNQYTQNQQYDSESEQDQLHILSGEEIVDKKIDYDQNHESYDQNKKLEYNENFDEEPSDKHEEKIDFCKNNLVISKGSKKWLGDTEIQCDDSFNENIYVYEHPTNNEENSNIILDVVEGNSLDRISVMATQMNDRHTINLFTTNRVPSRASMLVEAALDSVDISDKNNSNLISDNSEILHNIEMTDSDHIDIDEYGITNSSMVNRSMGHFISNNDKHDLDIDDISRNLQINNSPSNNMMNESEIDVSSLDDAGALRRSVENYENGMHHDFSIKHDEGIYQMKSDPNQQSDEDNRHQSRHYQMHHDGGVSPVATPIPRYDFNTHQSLTNDLSSDEEGMAQNLSLNLKVDRYQNTSYLTSKSYEIAANNQEMEIRSKYEAMLENDFRSERNSFEPIVTGELQGLDMTSRHQTTGYHNFQNRFHHPMHHHHLYDVTGMTSSVMGGDRQSVDLSMARNDLNLALNRSELGLNRSDLSLNRSEMNLNRSDLGLNRNDLGLNRSDLMLNRTDLSLNGNDLSLARNDLSLNRNDINLSLTRSDLILNRSELNLTRNDLSLNRSDLSLNRNDIGLNRTDLGLNTRDLSINRNDLSMNREDLGLTRSDLTLNRPDLGLNRSDLSLTPLNNTGTPTYSDVLRAAVSLDLTNGRHGIDTMGLPRSLHHHHAGSTSTSFSEVTHHAATRLLAAEHGLTANRLLPDPVHLLLDHHSHHHHHHHHHQSMTHHRLLSSPPPSTSAASAPTVDVVEVSPSSQPNSIQETNQNAPSSTSGVMSVGIEGVSPPRGLFSNYHAGGTSGFQLTQTAPQNVVGVGGAAFHPYSAGGYY